MEEQHSLHNVACRAGERQQMVAIVSSITCSDGVVNCFPGVLIVVVEVKFAALELIANMGYGLLTAMGFSYIRCRSLTAIVSYFEWILFRNTWKIKILHKDEI